MSHAPEHFTMDSGISFGKKNKITISNNLAILLLLAFIGCVITTGLLVYHFSSCTEDGENKTLHTDTENNTKINDIQETTTQLFTTTSIDNVILDTKQNVRLPKSIRPNSYDLKLVAFFAEKNFTFQGEVTILINVTVPTSNITLHSNELILDESNIAVTSVNNEFNNIKILNVHTKKELQFIIIELDGDLTLGQYSVYIKFEGVLNDVLQGFYRSSYKKKNNTVWIAATQFQPTDARRAFPCFDEPALKASFKISISRPNNMSAISNMPKLYSESDNQIENYTWDHFEKSVPMSTYLVAFVISDFQSKSIGNFSVWAREDAINQTLFSLGIGPKVLAHYEEFFQIPFPLPKIDMVALPDFSAGAMENWGLITYRESNLLYQDGVSSKSSQQSISIVVAHELAHQWFGNLVTPSWWTDLWLNEGFASYLEYIGTHVVHPEWKVLDQFVIFEVQVVFSLDALKTSHQISIEVSNPDEINDIFDRISYGKGATIIRMMDNFLTTKVFSKGLTNYLNEKMYESAQQDDLWQSLTAEAHDMNTLPAEMNVKEIMDTWTLQVGFPVVSVERNYEDNSILLKQERFLLEQADSVLNSSLWWIPISYTDKSNKLNNYWLKGVAEETLTNITTAENDWLLFNVNQTGYYRVNYDDKNWQLLTNELKDVKRYLNFDPKNRAQLVDDALHLASSGYIDFSTAMNVTTYLVNERDFVPWKASIRGLNYLYEMFVRTGHFDKFKDYMLYLIKPLYDEIGFKENTNDSLLMTNLRLIMLEMACKIGHVGCVHNSGMQFNNWMISPNPDENNPISPNLKAVLYCNGIKMGGEEEWNFAWQRYVNANVGSEKTILLGALSCTRETWLLNRYLTMAVTEGSGIRKQDAHTVFSAVGSNIIGQHLAYRFLTTNWDAIKLYMGSSFMSLNGIVRAVTMNFNTEQEVDDLKSFSAKKHKDLSSSSRTINQAIEQTWANIRWMSKNFNNLVDWLETFQK